MLRQGDSGAPIEELQKSLEDAGFDPGPIDGIFGPKTAAAVKAFQESEDLQVDGIAGPNTMGALAKASAKNEAATVRDEKAAFRSKLSQSSAARKEDEDEDEDESGPTPL